MEYAIRFWSKVDFSDGCWLWTAALYPQGYGMFSIARRRPNAAHRVAWELTHGPIPHGLSVCHTCDIPRCVRPDHLFLGTQAQNMADMKAKGRGTRANRGAGSARAVLSEADVKAIRIFSAAGFTRAALGRQFNVQPTAILKIVRRQRWQHVG